MVGGFAPSKVIDVGADGHSQLKGMGVLRIGLAQSSDGRDHFGAEVVEGTVRLSSDGGALLTLNSARQSDQGPFVALVVPW